MHFTDEHSAKREMSHLDMSAMHPAKLKLRVKCQLLFHMHFYICFSSVDFES